MSSSALATCRVAGQAVVATVLLASLGGLRAQYGWRQLPSPHNRSGHACAVDPLSGALIVHGGVTTGGETQGYPLDTWYHVAGHWQEPRAIATWVSYGENQQLLVDSLRGRLLLVGGRHLASGFHIDETSIWQFQAGFWTQLFAGSPNGPASPWTQYAYDDVRDRIVAYDPTVSPGATWEWSASGWTRMSPVQSPPQRYAAAFVFDRTRRRTVMFGGDTFSTMFSDTWEWDGVNWQQMATAVSPAPRAYVNAVHDPVHGRTLLVGGWAQTFFSDVWAYDANGWTLLSAAGAPLRWSEGVAYDAVRQRLMVMGGYDDAGWPCSDLWEWDGLQWQMVEPTTVPPDARLVTDLAQNKVLAFSGDGRVWERFRDGWVPVVVTGALPPARAAASFAYDAVRQRTVMFGGVQGQQLLNETWEWNGSRWSQAQPSPIPSPRQSAGMASDPTGGVLLFGGATAAGPANDTWRWNGTAWTQLLPSTPPPARTGPPMTLDPLRGLVVMFGDASGLLSDTWEWNGSQWFLRSPLSSPDHGMGLAFDQARGVATLIGHVPTTVQPPVYEQTHVHDWNGVNWTLRLQSSAPAFSMPVVFPSGFAYDPAAGRCVVTDSRYGTGGSFEIGMMRGPANVTILGPGCSPSLRLFTDPVYLGEPAQAWFECGTAPGPALLAIGLSSTSWAGTPLPLDLGAFGAPGCNLRVAPEAVVFLGPVVATVSPILYLTVPADPRFVGRDLSLQGMVLAPTANAAGLLLSAANTLRLGWH